MMLPTKKSAVIGSSWLDSWLATFPGYLFTVVAAIPVAALGWALIAKGFDRENVFIFVVPLAVLLGFCLEASVKAIFNQKPRKFQRTYASHVQYAYLGTAPIKSFQVGLLGESANHNAGPVELALLGKTATLAMTTNTFSRTA